MVVLTVGTLLCLLHDTPCFKCFIHINSLNTLNSHVNAEGTKISHSTVFVQKRLNQFEKFTVAKFIR
jgi:hypothetical protein